MRNLPSASLYSGLERTISVSKRWPTIASMLNCIFNFAVWSHFITRREAEALLESGRLLPMKGWFSLWVAYKTSCFLGNEMHFVGSCSSLPWLLYPSLVLCLSSLLVELSVGTVLWMRNKKQKPDPEWSQWLDEEGIIKFHSSPKQADKHIHACTHCTLYVLCNKLNMGPQTYLLLRLWWPRFDGVWKGELEMVV